MYKCTNVRAGDIFLGVSQINSKKNSFGYTLADHRTYVAYAITERLRVRAATRLHTRTRAKGGEQDGRLSRAAVWGHCL